MGTWAFGGAIAATIFVIGGLIALVRSITRFTTTLEFLVPALSDVSKSVKDLGTTVNKLVLQVAVLETAATQIPELREAVGRLERDLAVLNDKY